MNKKNILLSIVIPVYNVENYLYECVNSFLMSKNKNFEIILVDDGSTDNSFQICEMLCERDARVKKFHINNSGASEARNFGTKKAVGKYLFFCDSDDFVSTKEFDNVLKKIETTEADLYVFNKCNEGKEKGEYFEDTIGLTEGYTNNLNEIYRYTLNIRISAPWKKIFKMSIIKENKIKFPQNRILHEDLSYLLKYLNYVNIIYVLEQTLYYHRYTENSLSKQTKFEMFFDIYNTYCEMESLVISKNIQNKILNSAKNRYLAIIMGIIVRMKMNKVSNEEINKKIKDSNIDYILKNIRIIDKKSFMRYIFYKTKMFNIYYLLYKIREGKL